MVRSTSYYALIFYGICSIVEGFYNGVNTEIINVMVMINIAASLIFSLYNFLYK